MASVLGTSSVALFASRPSSSRSSKYPFILSLQLQRGQPKQPCVNGKRDKGKMHLSKEDIMYIGSGI